MENNNSGNAERFILVTGASRGLGRSIALKLFQENYAVILHARKEEHLAALLGEMGESERIGVLCADFADGEALKGFVAALSAQYRGRLYGIVNNAGIALDDAIAYQPERDIDMMLQVNLKAPIMIGKAGMKMFLKRKQGVIINISSFVGESGNAFQSVYAACKAGLVGLTKSWAKEISELLDEHMIRFLTVSPGFIDSDMTEKIPGPQKEAYLKRIASKRMGRPEEVAELVSFLVSDRASYMNGSQIEITGGLS